MKQTDPNDTMNTDHLAYYFPPLVSFWIEHKKNSNMRFPGAKVVISTIIVTIFTKTPCVLEAVFLVFRVVARIH
jgi:hypothetical protein